MRYDNEKRIDANQVASALCARSPQYSIHIACKGGFVLAKFRGPVPRRGPLPFRYVFLLTFVFFTFSTATGLWVINKGIEPTLMAYAESQTKKIATLVISKAINKRIVNGMNINDIIETTTNAENGTMVKLNTEIINRVMSETQTLIHMNLKEAERGNLESLENITDVEIAGRVKESKRYCL